MISVTRAGWNARPPDSVTPLNWSRVSLFIVHYSGASRDQSVRSIQDYCMNTKGHVDVDYNRLVRGEYDYMGRGDAVGGHTLNHNSASYGVCIIGRDGDATDADFTTVRAIYDQVCARLGRQLTMTDHQTVLGHSYTDCPGAEIHSWVAAGMPYPSAPEGDEVYAKFGDGVGVGVPPSNSVRYLQRQMLAAAPGAESDPDHPLVVDGEYGRNTAAWVSRLLTGGEGHEVDGDWFAQLDQVIIDKKVERALANAGSGAPAVPRRVVFDTPPLTATVTVPSAHVEADVTEVQ